MYVHATGILFVNVRQPKHSLCKNNRFKLRIKHAKEQTRQKQTVTRNTIAVDNYTDTSRKDLNLF